MSLIKLNVRVCVKWEHVDVSTQSAIRFYGSSYQNIASTQVLIFVFIAQKYTGIRFMNARNPKEPMLHNKK